mgnify:CR=1 FL=1
MTGAFELSLREKSGVIVFETQDVIKKDFEDYFRPKPLAGWRNDRQIRLPFKIPKIQ